ncbi:MAG: hypothetical protein ACR2P0_17950 [Acidimicrobiales bacterium]
MDDTRPFAGRETRAALGLLGLTAIAMFLPWSRVSGKTDYGIGTSEGVLTLLVTVLAMALTAAGIKPAWIASGLAAATLIRQWVDLGGDARIGLWVGSVCASIATAALITRMFASIERPDGAESEG